MIGILKNSWGIKSEIKLATVPKALEYKTVVVPTLHEINNSVVVIWCPYSRRPTDLYCCFLWVECPESEWYGSVLAPISRSRNPQSSLSARALVFVAFLPVAFVYFAEKKLIRHPGYVTSCGPINK